MTSRQRQTPRFPDAGRASLLEKLVAAVRPEFRAGIYLPGPGDPVLGAVPCTVPACDLPAKEHGLCSAHMLRWYRRGRLRIPIESDHLFRSNPIADSGVSDHLAGVGVS